MPRGRHRHAPPLHRLLAPAAIAAAALTCAGGALLAGGGGSGTWVLRGLSLGAAAAAVTGAVLMRRWDRAAGQRVAEVRAQRATLEWRAEERQAELETDLDEAREIRGKLEDVLRRKRAELERLRTEHAALLRRYATAETERATALEGRRQLAIAATEPARELTSRAADHRHASGAPTPLTYLQAGEALRHLTRSRARQNAEHQARRRAEAQVEQRVSALRAAQAEGRRLAEGEPGFDFFEAQDDPEVLTEQAGSENPADLTDIAAPMDITAATDPAAAEAADGTEADSASDAATGPEADTDPKAETEADREAPAEADREAPGGSAEDAPAGSAGDAPAADGGASDGGPSAGSVFRTPPVAGRTPPSAVRRARAAQPRPLGEREAAVREAAARETPVREPVEEPDLPHATPRLRPRPAGKVIDLAEHSEGETAESSQTSQDLSNAEGTDDSKRRQAGERRHRRIS
ncbi:hypothetical protein QNO07_02575 [Streptomyces sp. 549]|uniref:hypothetical protein n=1 Tax=Streptomyces sp. 549 TaxID=3049076 RepID=UPI0024C322A1|nr:hypothetical protein [Streptomyces sp. 549]MDK1472320.1 hypothetical protein [Streptomyces sp. 549]